MYAEKRGRRFFSSKREKNFRETRPDKKAAIKPGTTARERALGELMISSAALLPKMMGTDKRKEYSHTSPFGVPVRSSAVAVAPLRDTPAKHATPCMVPTKRAFSAALFLKKEDFGNREGRTRRKEVRRKKKGSIPDVSGRRKRMTAARRAVGTEARRRKRAWKQSG